MDYNNVLKLQSEDIKPFSPGGFARMLGELFYATSVLKERYTIVLSHLFLAYLQARGKGVFQLNFSCLLQKVK